MSYRNDPKKHSSGAKERLLFFFVAIATVAFFGFINKVQAYSACSALSPSVPCTNGTYDYDTFIKGHSFNAIFYNSARLITDSANFYYSGVGTGYIYFSNINNSLQNAIVYTGNPLSKYNGTGQFSGASVDEGANLIWVGSGAPYTPDFANYQGSDYFLNVSSPQLSESSKADVQPSANFKIKFVYNVPVEQYSNTHFQLWTCPNTDFNFPDCTVISSGSIQSIRDNLSDTDNLKNYIFAEAPVVLNEYTNLIAVLSDNRTTPYTAIYPAIFLLRGVNDTSLPSANSATIEGGFVQDLGFWGNLFRSMFVPTSQFMNIKTTEIKNTFSVKFPALADMQASVSTGVNTLSSAGTTYTSPTMNLYGANNMQILDTSVLTPYISQIKSWAGMFMWFFTAVFCFKAIRNLIHPKTD